MISDSPQNVLPRVVLVNVLAACTSRLRRGPGQSTRAQPHRRCALQTLRLPPALATKRSSRSTPSEGSTPRRRTPLDVALQAGGRHVEVRATWRAVGRAERRAGRRTWDGGLEEEEGHGVPTKRLARPLAATAVFSIDAVRQPRHVGVVRCGLLE